MTTDDTRSAGDAVRQPDWFDRYFAYHRLLGPVAADARGQWAYAIWDKDGRPNVWAFSRAGRSRRVTGFNEEDGGAARGLAVTADGRRMVVAADFAGRENQQLYVGPPDRPWVEWQRLPAPEDSQWLITATAWDPAGNRLAVAANDRARGELDVLIWTMGDPRPERVQLSGGYYRPVAWSPDGRWLTVVQIHHDTDTDALVVDTRSGRATRLTPHREARYYIPGPWTASGDGFYLLSNADREFLGLYRWDRAEDRPVAVEETDGDVEDVAVGAIGVVYTVNDNGASRVYRIGKTGGREEILHGVGHVAHLYCPSAVPLLLGVRDTPDRPADLWAWDPTEGPMVLSQSFYGDPPPPLQPTSVHYRSADGLRVHAWWYPAASDRAPAVMLLHGGPEAQERPRYTATVRALVANGVHVLVPNGRGSTGYGRAYQRAVYRDWGGGDLDDAVAGAAFIRRQAVSDGRVAVMGGSYGGFLVLSLLLRRPELDWAAGVAIDAPSDLVEFARTVPPAWRSMMDELLGHPERDAEELGRRSPARYADRLMAPLLLVHGGNDPRVPRAQSDRLAATLERLGKPFRYHVVAGEGHDFVGRDQSRTAHRLSLQFLLRHLGKPVE